jgi:hypothetical protein
MLVMAALLLALGSVADSDDSSRAGRAAELSAQSSATPPNVDLDAVGFVRRIDNAWWPMANGASWRYRRIAGGKTTRIVVTVSNHKRTVRGIEATAVRSVSFVNGRRTEDARAWYAQDRVGNVWYLGRDARQYANGALVGTAGSWEVGVDGAEAGIVIPANAKVGSAYLRERRGGAAESRGRIVSADQAVEVPGGVFARTLVTEKTTLLEAPRRQHTIFARGVGPVLTIDVSGRSGRIELVRFTRGPKGP